MREMMQGLKRNTLDCPVQPQLPSTTSKCFDKNQRTATQMHHFREEKNKSPKLEVYGGFTPTGEPAHPGLVDYFMRKHHDWSKKKMDAYFKGYEGQALKNKEAGSLPDAPQNNLGAYTLQAGIP